ncbi:MAG: sialate O-acetylesterase [Akkermansiaceae bacterium]
MFLLVCQFSNGSVVWNVNVGNSSAGSTNAITTANNYLGAASENTANSTWNAVSATSAATLADSTGSSVAGVTIKITPDASSSINFGGSNLTSGDKIFNTWIKDDGNDDPFTVTFGNLPAPGAGESYALVVYADWWWAPQGNPVAQTAGSGLSGTFFVNSLQGGAHVNGIVGSLLEDTNPLDDRTLATNFSRFNGLTPDINGDLTFSMGGVNAPINGFQLILITGGAPDTIKPTPDPMTWASSPAATGSTSITMTATTAIDLSGVEYFFDETSGNPGGSDSGWQNSPTYTDSGLDPETSYTYTVMARDKSAAKNTTASSAAASATTGVATNATVWNLQFGNGALNLISPSDNFVGAATENTQNSTWNRVSSVPQSNFLLADSEGNTADSITFDITGSNVAGQALTTGDKIFTGYIGGAGATANISFKGLSLTDSYDLVFYSDWYWYGDAYPVRQTVGTGMSGTVYLNRITSRAKGAVPVLTEDPNPANVSTGSGNLGNWQRIEGLSPTVGGELSFLIGDGANAPINGFQLVRTGAIPPRADYLTFGLPGNPGVIGDTDVTLTLPYGSDVTNLAPTFTLWPGATSVPASGTARNFTSPQVYTVTSSDSQVVKNYIVTAEIAPPLPEFNLTSPASWDGRQTITVQPNITNLALLQANNGTNFNYQWSVSGLAVTKQVTPGVLELTHSQGSGPLVVTLTLDNGGFGVTESITINVQEPASDPWVERTPAANEKPVTGQFFARNPDTGFGTIHYNGTQAGTPDTVYLKLYKTPSGAAETLDATYRQPLVNGAYAFSFPVTAGLITYRVVYGTTTGVVDTDVATVTDLVCGDAYIIEGQSNAVATDNSAPRDNTTSPWIRTYGRSGGAWSYARSKAPQEFWEMNIGFWGMQLAQNIVTDHQMPVCIINGAVGGTRIDQHQANPAGHTIAGTDYTIYANLLNRVIDAKLTNGIRGVFWHQGESDGSNFGPISDFDYTAYEENFLNMSVAWKEDYPNIQGYIIFQVNPRPCSIGPKGDQVREVQRTLPRLYSNMNILTAVGVMPYGGCHYTLDGYNTIGDMMASLVNQDFYGIQSGASVTSPNLVQAYFTSPTQDAIVLEFDQNIASWDSGSNKLIFLDDVSGQVSSGSVSDNIVTLQLIAPSNAATITYLRDSLWNNVQADLIYGANSIAALTFADVPLVSPPVPSAFSVWASDPAQALTAGVNDGAMDDPDFDGLNNFLEFVLGGNPIIASTSPAPILNQSAGGSWSFEYERSHSSHSPAITQIVEYSDDLKIWTEVPIPAATSGIVTVTPGSMSDHISVTIPNSTSNMFVRLKVSE